MEPVSAISRYLWLNETRYLRVYTRASCSCCQTYLMDGLVSDLKLWAEFCKTKELSTSTLLRGV